jgi:phosphoribosylformylglycinamidine cyclo-ligase
MAENDSRSLTYESVGVKTTNVNTGMEGLIRAVRETMKIRPTVLDLGYYASVIDIGQGMGIAMATDGVGTKILVAEMAGKYDTVGIDCVAMNVNDIICVGARPLSMVDYIAVQEARDDLLTDLARGLLAGAKLARINIPGGEVAQLKEMVTGIKPGYGFDLVGTCVGTVALDKLVIGEDVRPGDAIIGIVASGIHSNGLTLARRVLFDQMKLDVNSYLPEFGRPLGEELLEPTAIYVDEVMALLESGLAVKSLTHITSDGFLNLTRAKAQVGYEITDLPATLPIYEAIAAGGPVEAAEMYQVFNMGIGFCAVVSEKDADKAVSILGGAREARVIGRVTDDPEERVVIKQHNLVGKPGTHFHQE